MPSPLILKIDVKKLKKEWFFNANSGAVYADLMLYYNDEPDQYGNNCSIKQNPPKAVKEHEPEAKGHYVGNAKIMQRREDSPRPQQTKPEGKYRKANLPPPTAGHEGDDWDSEPPF